MPALPAPERASRRARDAALRDRRGLREPCRILTAAHAGTLSRGGRIASPAAGRAARDPGGVERGAQSLRLRSRRACAARPARRRPGWRPPGRGAVPRRAAATGTSGATHDGTQRSVTSPTTWGSRRSRRGNVHAHTPRRTLLQDALVAIRCRTSLDGRERERRGPRRRVLRSRPRWSSGSTGSTALPRERTGARRAPGLRPHRRGAGYRYPDFSDRPDSAIRQLAVICDHAFGERYAASCKLLQAKARARLDDELALIERLGLAGFFLLHHEALEPRQCALEVRGRDSPRMFLPPGRGRGARSARSSAT